MKWAIVDLCAWNAGVTNTMCASMLWSWLMCMSGWSIYWQQVGTSAYFLCNSDFSIFWPSVYCCADLHMAAFVSLLVTGLVESGFHLVLMRLRLVWDLEFRMRMLDCKHLWGLLLWFILMWYRNYVVSGAAVHYEVTSLFHISLLAV
jgi:hypothetical protein